MLRPEECMPFVPGKKEIPFKTELSDSEYLSEFERATAGLRRQIDYVLWDYGTTTSVPDGQIRITPRANMMLLTERIGGGHLAEYRDWSGGRWVCFSVNTPEHTHSIVFSMSPEQPYISNEFEQRPAILEEVLFYQRLMDFVAEDYAQQRNLPHLPQ